MTSGQGRPSGEKIKNKMLAALPPAALADILPHMEPIELIRDQGLYKTQGRVRRVHFLQSGLAVFTKMMRDGRSTMIGSIGIEGMTQPNGLLGAVRTDIECTVQIPGLSLAIDADMLHGLSARIPALSAVLERYGMFMNEQSAQISGCNRLHALEQRCARLLLTIHDNVFEEGFPLTQETLAIMLGAQRPHVSAVAANFQNLNMIQYKHGQMRIANYTKLRQVSCECYEVLKIQADKAYTFHV